MLLALTAGLGSAAAQAAQKLSPLGAAVTVCLAALTAMLLLGAAAISGQVFAPSRKSRMALEEFREFAELRFRAADNAFHLAIADAARNHLMRQAIEDARAATWVPIDLLINRVFLTANRHHKQILDAIVGHDPDAAQRAVVDHLETARRDLRRSLR